MAISTDKTVVLPHFYSFTQQAEQWSISAYSSLIPLMWVESQTYAMVLTSFTWQVRNVFLRSRLYRARTTSPLNPSVHTRCSSSDPQTPRYPCVEGLLDYPGIQAHIHDIYVIIRHRRVTSTFRIFFKRHLLLPLNHVLGVQGDVLIMRVASKSRSSVVNMRGSDWRLADFIANRWVTDNLRCIRTCRLI